MSFAVWFSSCQYFVALISVDTVDLASRFWWSLSVLSSDRIHRSLSVHTPTCRQWGCFRVRVCLVAQSCPTLFDPMDCSSPSSSVHGILQARILEWAAISYSRGSISPGMESTSPALLHWQADSSWLSHLGSPGVVSTLIIVDEPVSLSWTGSWSQLYHKEN